MYGDGMSERTIEALMRELIYLHRKVCGSSEA